MPSVAHLEPNYLSGKEQGHFLAVIYECICRDRTRVKCIKGWTLDTSAYGWFLIIVALLKSQFPLGSSSIFFFANSLSFLANTWSMHWKNNNAIRPSRSSAERVNLPKHHVGPNFINWSPMLCIKKGHCLLQINMEPVANLQINQLELLEISTWHQ